MTDIDSGGASSSSSVLGDHIALQRGTTYKGSLLGRPGPVLLGLASIQRNGGFRDDNLKTYGGPSASNILLAPGELYVSLKDVTQTGDLLGAVARLPASISAGRLTQDTVKLILRDPAAANPEYLYWLLQTPQYRSYCRLHATGTTTLGLSRESFLAYKVPHLSRARREIVATLSALERKVESNRRVANRIDDIVVVDSERISGTQTRIDAVATVNRASYNKATLPEIIDYIDISGVSQRRIDTSRPMTFAMAPSRARRRLTRGDTIISTVRPERRSLAFVERAENALVASTGFAVLTPTLITPSLLYALATSERASGYYAAAATGSAYPAVSADAIAAFEIPVPEDRGEAFESRNRPLLALQAGLLSEARALTAVRDALLPRLVSGQIRVPLADDPEERIGAAVEALDAAPGC